MTIELDPTLRDELVAQIKQYFSAELDQELGSFDAQFLLDFFARRAGCHFYNQGLADAFKAFESRLAEFGELVYELEQQPEKD
ncbi:MAG: DUF2164 domain-containing protein [Pseudomonadales bacterium]